jgi:hypothetical protein
MQSPSGYEGDANGFAGQSQKENSDRTTMGVFRHRGPPKFRVENRFQCPTLRHSPK